MIEILFLFAICLVLCFFIALITTYAMQTSTSYLLLIPIIIGVVLVSYLLYRAYTLSNSKEYKEQKNRYKVLAIRKHIRKIKFRHWGRNENSIQRRN